MALKISIVTACYNSGATVRESILSVARQNYPEVEHIIVDGASKDDTMEIVVANSIPGASIISEPDHGIYDAWNKGIRRATGDYIWLLNSDDQIFDSDTVKETANYILAHNRPAFLYGKVNGYEASSGYTYVAGKPTELRDFVFGMRDFCILATIIRKDVFERIGYFNTNYHISSDYDWAITLFKSLPGEDILFYDRILTNFSVGGISNRRYREAYAEVAEIVWRHFSVSDYVLHKIFMSWRISLMFLLPYARSAGVLSSWRRLRDTLAKKSADV